MLLRLHLPREDKTKNAMAVHNTDPSVFLYDRIGSTQFVGVD